MRRRTRGDNNGIHFGDDYIWLIRPPTLAAGHNNTFAFNNQSIRHMVVNSNAY